MLIHKFTIGKSSLTLLRMRTQNDTFIPLKIIISVKFADVRNFSLRSEVNKFVVPWELSRANSSEKYIYPNIYTYIYIALNTMILIYL